MEKTQQTTIQQETLRGEVPRRVRFEPIGDDVHIICEEYWHRFDEWEEQYRVTVPGSALSLVANWIAP